MGLYQSRKKVLLIGSGRRAQGAILPALYCLKDELELIGVYSRTVEELRLFGGRWELKTTTNLSDFNFSEIDLIIVAITLESVPEVIGKLCAYQVSHIVLMLDTPVLPHTRLGTLRKFKNFKRVLASEDNIALPLYRLARKLIDEGRIGKVKKISFFHSGETYHALAALRMMTRASCIRAIKSVDLKTGKGKREITLADNMKATIYEPRDYRIGKFLIEGEKGKISDYEENGDVVYRIEYLEKNGIYQGLKLNGVPVYQDELDRTYVENLPQGLALREKTLIATMKIRGLMELIRAANKLPCENHYLAINGIYDNLAIRASERFGYFRDFSIGFNGHSVFRLFIKFLARILPS